MSEEPLLIPNETYLKAGVHIGTKFKTKYMEPYIFKIRPDGLAVLNMSSIDERLKAVSTYLSSYEPKDILVVARRENAWKPAVLFGRMTGARVVTARYPPGMLTNPNLEGFFEPKVLVATDPWPDRNPIKDAKKMNIPVVAFCDTNNTTQDIDVVMPCNNKGKKSLGLVFYLLGREYMLKRGLIKKEEDLPYKIDDFMEEQ
ncbi:MAG: 30S ribosomal protein S2 [Candidatus Woesearchaeota archaeon]